MAVTEDGSLRLTTAAGEVRHSAPVAFESGAPAGAKIACRFVLLGANEVGFEVGPRDARRALTIDPTIYFLSYLGNVAADGGLAVTRGERGDTWVGGLRTISAGNSQGFVSRLSPSGQILWETLIGGSAAEAIRGVAVDASDRVHFTGFTTSIYSAAKLPTTQGAFGKSCFDPPGPAQCAVKLGFVGQLGPDGTFANGKGYVSYLGGSFSDEAWGIAVTPGGIAFVVGDARSIDIPGQTITSPPHVVAGSPNPTDDAFLAQIAPGGGELTAVAYLGGSGADYGRGVALALDQQGRFVVTAAGTTTSQDLSPAAGAAQETPAGANDGFAAQLVTVSTTGVALALQRYTYFGGSGGDVITSVSMDPETNAYFGGETGSADFPLTNGAFAGGLSDAFVFSLSPGLRQVRYSVRIGGSAGEIVNGVAADGNGSAHVTGHTDSTDFPVTAECFLCAPPPGSGGDAFYARVNGDGLGVGISYLGGAAADHGHAIAADPLGGVTIVGATSSPDLQVTLATGPVQGYSGSSDVMVVGLSPCGAAPLDPGKLLDVIGGTVGDRIVAGDDVSGLPPVRTSFVATPNWEARLGVTLDDGLVLQDVKLGWSLDGPECGVGDVPCQLAGHRFMAERISLPYFELDVHAPGYPSLKARGELAYDSISGATPADFMGRSRLVDLTVEESARKLTATATYEVMTEPPVAGQAPKSCLIVKQHQELFSRMGSNRCELTSRALCNRFRPLIEYRYYPPKTSLGSEPIFDFKPVLRFGIRPDRTSAQGVSMLGDNHGFAPGISGPILYSLIDKPLPVEAYADAIVQGKPAPVPGMMYYGIAQTSYNVSTQTVDNVHHSAKKGPVDEPRLDLVALAKLTGVGATPVGVPFIVTCAALAALGIDDCFPHLIIPGCPDCVHMHWRWSEVPAATLYSQFPQFYQGNLTIPPGSEEDGRFYYTYDTDLDPMSVESLVAPASESAPASGEYLLPPPVSFPVCNDILQCEPLDGYVPVLWYRGRTSEFAGRLMHFGGWFHATGEVGGSGFPSPRPPSANPLD
ncbi:MAG: SBBP repeat-containing protein [Polyangiaceae bacterium]